MKKQCDMNLPQSVMSTPLTNIFGRKLIRMNPHSSLIHHALKSPDPPSRALPIVNAHLKKKMKLNVVMSISLSVTNLN